MNLILFEPDERRGDRVRAVGARALHLREVLRVQRGDEVRIGIIDGPVGTGRVLSCDPEGVDLACAFDAGAPPSPAVDLVLALPRPKVLRRLFAPIAALGVRRLMLTNAARVERPYFDTHVLGADCYRTLLIEGLQQARDTRLPAVSVHRQFRPLVEDLLAQWPADSLRIVAHPGDGPGLHMRLRQQPAARILLALGPEGGWIPFELELLRTHGFVTATLGPRPLRSDTACVATLALAHDALRQSLDAVAASRRGRSAGLGSSP